MTDYGKGLNVSRLETMNAQQNLSEETYPLRPRLGYSQNGNPLAIEPDFRVSVFVRR